MNYPDRYCGLPCRVLSCLDGGDLLIELETGERLYAPKHLVDFGGAWCHRWFIIGVVIGSLIALGLLTILLV